MSSQKSGKSPIRIRVVLVLDLTRKSDPSPGKYRAQERWGDEGDDSSPSPQSGLLMQSVGVVTLSRARCPAVAPMLAAVVV